VRKELGVAGVSVHALPVLVLIRGICLGGASLSETRCPGTSLSAASIFARRACPRHLMSANEVAASEAWQLLDKEIRRRQDIRYRPNHFLYSLSTHPWFLCIRSTCSIMLRHFIEEPTAGTEPTMMAYAAHPHDQLHVLPCPSKPSQSLQGHLRPLHAAWLSSNAWS